MADEPTLSIDEVRQVRQLLDIERIRKKKQLYSHLLDSLRLEEWADLFTDDAIADWGPYGHCQGRSAILDQSRVILEGRQPYASLHMTTNLWIELTGPDTATSRDDLMDVSTDPSPRTNPVRFFGVYEFDWTKVGGDWKIACQRNRFLWPERMVDGDFPLPLIASPLG